MFLTLTYDTRSVPITKRGFMTLCKADVQKFFKRLRKILPEAKIKYYAVGEYGGRTMRPHYHIILFNADHSAVTRAWRLDNKDIGSLYFGTVSGASIGYCLKYMMKPSKVPLHANDDRIKEFSLVSKGLGANYMSDAMIKWHKRDLEHRMYCNLKDGKKIAMPRYYKDKIYSESERERVAFFARMDNEERMLQYQQKLIEEYGEDAARVKLEADKAAFEKMYRDSLKNRNKI